jgi:hypothetical protein
MLSGMVKVRVRLVAESLAEPVAQPPPLLFEDLAPRLPRAEIVLVGAARSPTPVGSMSVRLFVSRESAVVLDKALHVYGDRPTGGFPTPFLTMPLTYDRTVGGPGTDNPVGRSGSVAPNVVDPHDKWKIASFAPIDPRFPARQRLAGAAPPRLEGVRWILPDNVSFDYFQSAPPDQQVSHLDGDEWLVMDGMHPSHGRFRSQLPGLLPTMQIVAPIAAAAPLRLKLERLLIDMTTLQADLTYRGTTALRSGEGRVQLVGGLASAIADDLSQTHTEPGAPVHRAPASESSGRHRRCARAGHRRGPRKTSA